MIDFSKILLPIDLEEPSLSAAHQAAVLARYFHSEIVMLHVVKPLTYLSLHEVRHKEILSERVTEAEAKLDASLKNELDGIAVRRVVLKGDPAAAILQAAHDEQAKLIVMGTHGFSGVPYFLVGSVTAKILSSAECPIWTGAHLNAQTPTLEIKSIICGLDFSPRDLPHVKFAGEMAQKLGAKLTLAHVTPSVDIYGPGGLHEIPELKKALIGSAQRKIADLQEQTGVKSDVYIGSGDVPKMMDEAAKQVHADLQIIGRRPSAGWLGGSAYPIISRSHIAVLSL